MDRIVAFALLASVALTGAARADVIAAWTDSLLNVSTSVAAHTGPNAAGAELSRGPSLGYHSSINSYSSIGWTTAPSPDPDDYVQITADTSGYENMVVKFDAYGGSSGPSEMQLTYSDSGPAGTFTSAPDAIILQNSVWVSFTIDLSSVPVLDDNADVALRIHGFDSFSLAGSARFAVISIEGDPLTTSVDDWFLLDD